MSRDRRWPRASALALALLIAPSSGRSATDTRTGPVADHHVHLLSPAGVALLTPPLLPEVRLPDDLARVLRARCELRNDPSGLEKLYTPDAIYFTGGTVGFARGSRAVAGHVRWTVSDYPYRIVPVSYSLHGSSAQIAGYFMEGRNFDSRFGFSQLSLVKEGSVPWRIASETYVFQEPPPPFKKPLTAADKIAELDAVGTQVAAVLSDGYYYDSVRPEPVPDAYARVRAENDWTARQVAAFPNRLFAFCSFNPLADYALAELRRCAASGGFTGLKLHFNAAQVNLGDPRQVERVRRVMREANRLRMPMIVHVRTGKDYGRRDAEVFVRQLVAAAPDVPIQIAHLWGGESYSAEALAVFAEAVARRDPAVRNLFFDVSGVAAYGKPKDMPEIVRRMRQIGVPRMVYGSDGPPAESWDLFQRKVPLTQEEFRAIAAKIAPYLEPRRGRTRRSSP